MKVVSIADIHGRNIWKDIIEQNPDADKIVFTGDYFDTHEDYTVKEICLNAADIVKYKRANPDKVILLIGNHDYQYGKWNITDEKYTKEHEYNMSKGAAQVVIEMGELEMCYQIPDTDILMSHAGVSPMFLKAHYIDIKMSIQKNTIADDLNILFKDEPEAFSFMNNARHGDPYGDEVTQSPIWIRPASLMSACQHFPYRQIVGHTTQKNIKVVKDKYYFTDVLGTSKEYLVIEDGVINIKQL